jgi:hypothetical protein
VLSQIKNNLGREDLPSLKYEIQPVSVETPEGLSYVSRFRFTGEESERSVRDLLRGSGGEDPDANTERDEAATWLRDYLTDCGGEAPRKDLLKAARAEGFSEATLKRATRKAGVRPVRSGFQGGSTWKLQPHPDRHSGHSDHTSERELNGLNESRMEQPDSHSAQSAHASMGDPAEPHARHVRQHSEGGEHGEHDGEHGAQPEDDTKAPKAPAHEDVSPSAPSLSSSPSPPEPTPAGRLLDLDSDAPRSGQRAYACNRCGLTTTALVDMTGLPHPHCGGRFQPVEPVR